MNADSREVDTDTFDAGLLNDYGGGNVEWWQDYIRALLSDAHEFYMAQLDLAALPTHPPPEPLSREGVETDTLFGRMCSTAADLESFEDLAWFGAVAKPGTMTRLALAADIRSLLALAQTHPVSSPGEGWRVVPATATRGRASSLANRRQGQSSTPRCESPGEYEVNRAAADIAEVLSASPAQPARQQDQGLTASRSPPSPTLQAARAQSQHVDGKESA